VTCSCSTWQEVVSAENWDEVNVKLDIAVSSNGYAEGDESLLPCAQQQTEQLYQEVADKNQEGGKE